MEQTALPASSCFLSALKRDGTVLVLSSCFWSVKKHDGTVVLVLSSCFRASEKHDGTALPVSSCFPSVKKHDETYTSVVDVCNTNSCVHSNYAPEHISIRVIKAITTLSWRLRLRSSRTRATAAARCALLCSASQASTPRQRSVSFLRRALTIGGCTPRGDV